MTRRTMRWRAAMLAAAMVLALGSMAACNGDGGGAGTQATRSAGATTPRPTLLPIVKTLAANLPTAYAEATAHTATFPAGPPIAGMSWVSADAGWVVRGSAQILHTTDGGTTWKLQYQQDGLMAVAIQFIDAQHGWVAGRSGPYCHQDVHATCAGALLRTADGGTTWAASSPTESWIDGLRFTSALSGWVTAFTICNPCAQNPLVVLHTNDGGLTWTQHTLVDFPMDASKAHALAAIGARSALVVTSEKTYRTDDSGATWRTVSASPCTHSESVVQGGALARADMLDTTTGWAICAGGAGGGMRGSSLFETKDGGVTWALISDFATTPAHPLPGVGIFPGGDGQMQFLDALYGWYVDDERGMWANRTSDGGHTWEGIQTPIFDFISMVQFVDREHGWIANDRQIAGTTDGGAHWTEIALPP